MERVGLSVLNSRKLGNFFFFSNLKFKRRVKSMLLRERERDAYEAFKRKGKDLFDAREIGVLQI